MGAGFLNSVTVEFDTFPNPGFNDPATDHVGIDTNNNFTSIVTNTVANFTNGAQTYFDSVSQWYVWVDFTAATQLLEVRVSTSPTRPQSAVVFCNINITQILGTGTANFGFGGGTGGYNQRGRILSWELDVAGILYFFFLFSLLNNALTATAVTIGQNVLMYGFSSKYFETYGTATLPGYAIVTPGSDGQAGTVYFDTPLTYYRNGTHLNFEIFFSIVIDDLPTSGSPGDGMTIFVAFFFFFFFFCPFGDSQGLWSSRSPQLSTHFPNKEISWDMAHF